MIHSTNVFLSDVNKISLKGANQRTMCVTLGELFPMT